MLLEAEERGAAKLVRVMGRLELGSVKLLEKEFKELVRPDEAALLDLSGVTHVDSSGISVLVALHRRNKQFFLVEPAPPLANLLRLANLNRFFTILSRADCDARFPAT